MEPLLLDGCKNPDSISMVAKLLRPLTVSMNADSLFVYTSQVSEEDLASAETLRHSPMVFQELIPKARELRTTGGMSF
jgi:hypothetical protein